MLINLINTILISCGMAINGSNFNYEKKSHKNANSYEEIYIDIHENYKIKGSAVSYTSDGFEWQVEKSLLDNDDNAVYSKNPNLVIVNTAYSYKADLNNTHFAFTQNIITITSYYNTDINVQLKTGFYNVTGTQTTTTRNSQIYQNYNNSGSVIDLTLNSNTYQTVQNYIASGTLIEQQTENVDNTEEIQIVNNFNIPARSTVSFTFYNERQSALGPYQTVGPNRFDLTGTANIPTQPIEVVDVPGLMFTILTLPFSFISQAFNLTIFPNTPYQINFTNLFLTIISIFVLIWLIKHIFK